MARFRNWLLCAVGIVAALVVFGLNVGLASWLSDTFGFWAGPQANTLADVADVADPDSNPDDASWDGTAEEWLAEYEDLAADRCQREASAAGWQGQQTEADIEAAVEQFADAADQHSGANAPPGVREAAARGCEQGLRAAS